MTVTIGGIELTFLLDMKVNQKSHEQLPEWLNQATPSIADNFYNRPLVDVMYQARVSDYDKWLLDQMLRNHSSVQLEDTILNLTVNAYIDRLEYQWTSDNWERPWIVNIYILDTILVPSDKMIEFNADDWACFARQGQIYFGEPQLTEGGGEFPTEGGVFFGEPEEEEGGGKSDEYGYYTWIISSDEYGYVSEEGTFTWTEPETGSKTLTAYPNVGRSFYRWIVTTHDGTTYVYTNPYTFVYSKYVEIFADFQ